MFLISSHYHSKYDFDIISQTITAILPKLLVHQLLLHVFKLPGEPSPLISCCYEEKFTFRRKATSSSRRKTQNKVKALSTIFGCAARIGALQCSPCSTGHCQKRTHLIPFIGVAVASTFFFRCNILLSANTGRYRKTRY
ncbi:hypothetical protein pdam_00020854 [Pocillopora damicornis]|uniref:Uncharacterized protein n=1 Tax=Pocillopora damicornis TaxID=46731 RepID=A0A3M6UUW3_POCDA|nr:hypothetical protein pdam_00020854 [Pocillopora damicornis]